MPEANSLSLKGSHKGLAMATWLALQSLLALGLPSWGEGGLYPQATLHITGPDSLICDSGATVSYLLRIQAPSSDTGSYLELIDYPQNWKSVLGPKTRDFAKEQGCLRLLAFQIPLDTAPGSYAISYALDHSEGRIEKITRIQVRERNGVKLQVLERPSLLIAGESGQVNFLVSNRGNTELDLNLTAESRGEWPVTLSESRILLPAGQSRTVTATLFAPQGLDRQARSHLRLLAQAALESATLEPASADLVLDAVPRISRGTDPWRRLPTEIQILTHRWKGKTSLSGQWRGRGFLDAHKQHEFEFLLRGPDSRSFGAFGRREEYRLALRSPNSLLLLGDGPYGLSPLTRTSLQSRGLEFSLDTNTGLRGGAFFIERPGVSDLHEIGAYLGGSTESGGHWRLNLLGKPAGVAGGPLNVGLASLQADLPEKAGIFTELEAGLSRGGTGSEGLGGAYRMHLHRTQGRLGLRLERIFASEDYRGTYRDHDYLAAEVSAALNKSWNARVMGQRWKRKIYEDGAVSPGWEQRAEFGVHHQSRRGLTLGLSGITSGLKASSGESRWGENFMRMESRLSLSSHSLGLRVELGERDSHESQAPASLMRAALSLRLKLRSWLSLSMAGTRNHLDGGISPGTSDTGQIALLMTPHSRFTLSLRATASEYRFHTHSSYRQVDMGGRYRISRELYLDAQARVGQSGDGQWQPSIMLGITRSLGMPLARTARLARLEGRVVDSESPSGAGVADLLLRLDSHTAVTDAKGNFSFPNIPAGDYRLDLPRPSLGVEQALVEKAPLHLCLAEGDRQSIQLSVARTASLSGRIMRYASTEGGTPHTNRPNGLFLEGRDRANWGPGEGGDPLLNDDNLVELGGLEGALLKLSGKGRSFYRLSGPDGHFRFDELPPGIWTLEVEDSELPSNHFVEENRHSFQLAPGEDTKHLVKVLPRFRPVRIIDQESLQASGPIVGKDSHPVLSSRRSVSEGKQSDPVHRRVTPPGPDEPGAEGRAKPVPAQRPAPGTHGVYPDSAGGATGGERSELEQPVLHGRDLGAGQLHGSEGGPGRGQRSDLLHGHPASAIIESGHTRRSRGRGHASSHIQTSTSNGTLDSLLPARRICATGSRPAHPGRSPPLAGNPRAGLAGAALLRGGRRRGPGPRSPPRTQSG